MRRWGKAFGVVVLACIFAFAGMASALAASAPDPDGMTPEEYYAAYGEFPEDTDTLLTDTAIAHWGVAMTANMQARAFYESENEEDYSVQWQLQQFSSVYTMHPRRFLVVDLTDKQADYLKNLLGVANMRAAAAPIGAMLNADYEEYDTAASMATWERVLYTSAIADEFGTESPGAFVAFLTYNEQEGRFYNSQIVLITGDEEGLGSSFVISSAVSAMEMDASYITDYTDMMGLTDLVIREYSEEEVTWMMGWDKENTYTDEYGPAWSEIYTGVSDDYLSAISTSEDFMKQAAAQCAEGYGLPELCAKAASDYIFYEKNAEAAAFISGNVLEPLRYGEDGMVFLQEYLTSNNTVRLKVFEEGEAPEIIGSEGWDVMGEELEVFPENAKVLIVFHQYAEDEFDTMGVDWALQAAVPIGNMPDAPSEPVDPSDLPSDSAELDYIIYCDVTYDGDTFTQGNLTLIYPYNHITVHDARTGEIVKDLGTVVRRLNGFATVTSDVTYWAPLHMQAWEAIRDMFPAPVMEENEAGEAEIAEAEMAETEMAETEMAETENARN